MDLTFNASAHFERRSPDTLLGTCTRQMAKVRTMSTEELKQLVKSRYSKFAEAGGRKEAC